MSRSLRCLPLEGILATTDECYPILTELNVLDPLLVPATDCDGRERQVGGNFMLSGNESKVRETR